MTALFATPPPTHHPDDGILTDYASGAAHEAAAVMVATHLALCGPCRDTVRHLEQVGGALIEDLPPSALLAETRDRVMARLDDGAREPARAPDAPSEQTDPLLRKLPSPLHPYLSGGNGPAAWRRLGPTVDQIELPVASTPRHEHLRLLRIKAGAAIPRHTHDGTEMVLVLSGGFRDGAARFGPGDVSLSDAEVDHSPMADPDEDCLCLSVTDAPLRFTGLFGRILNLFVRF